MAIKVVGKDKKKIRKVTCNNCSSILEFTNSDIKGRTYKDISQVTETVYYIVCPDCRKQIEVNYV